MKRVLVTGATGFIGRHVLAPLQDLGFEVHAVARCRRGPQPARKSFGTSSTFSNRSPPIGSCPNSARRISCISLGSRNMASIGRPRKTSIGWRRRCGWFARFSARAESGWSWRAPAPNMTGRTHRFHAMKTRRACSSYALRHREERPANNSPIVLTPRVNCNGPGAASSCFTVPARRPERFVPSLVRSLAQGGRAVCRSSNLVRDLMHVSDVGRAFAILLDSEVTGPVNIATGAAVSLGAIAREIARQLQR